MKTIRTRCTKNSGLVFACQKGQVAIEYTILLVFVAAVLFTPFTPSDGSATTTLWVLMLNAIKSLNITYTSGLTFMATMF